MNRMSEAHGLLSQRQLLLQQIAADRRAVRRADPLTTEALSRIAVDDYAGALNSLASAGISPDTRNLKGVCLMRLGRFEDAVRIYRSFVLQPNCTWVRPELPVSHKFNFATALLHTGRVAGCLSVLHEIRCENHAGIKRLRHAIREWEKSMSFWTRLNWRFGLEPQIKPPTPEGPVGDLDVSISPGQTALASKPTNTVTSVI